ncbi:MAG: phage holin family protein, partial [Oscillospiraceae bacterium]|nr:phage holin family protein [Oscillospiraceae bacterium]
TALITPIVIAWYTVTELGSVIENAAKMGAPIPKWLRKILKITADAIDKTGNGIAGEEKDDEKDGD